jgi:bifunctional enzyme CysN/CysC
MPWYEGPSLLHHLERSTSPPTATSSTPLPGAVRHPPESDEHHDYRGYAGQVAGGVLKPGDEVVVLPSAADTSTTIAGDRHEPTAPLDEAFPPMSVTVRLADDVDVSAAT